MVTTEKQLRVMRGNVLIGSFKMSVFIQFNSNACLYNKDILVVFIGFIFFILICHAGTSHLIV